MDDEAKKSIKKAVSFPSFFFFLFQYFFSPTLTLTKTSDGEKRKKKRYDIIYEKA
jgi:hypothetical protein